MPRTDNYPDDIRCYDHDPRSPFYEGPDENLEERAERLTEEWLANFPELAKQAERLELEIGVSIEVDADEDGLYEVINYRCNGCGIEGDENEIAKQLARLDVESDTLGQDIEKIVPDYVWAAKKRHWERLRKLAETQKV